MAIIPEWYYTLQNELNFPLELNFSGKDYSLRSLLWHDGAGVDEGHYVAVVKQWNSNAW